MKRIVIVAVAVALAAAAGTVGGYWLAERNLLGNWFAARQAPDIHTQHAAVPANTAAGEEAKERKVLYYKNPMGGPDTSPVPKKDAMGMDYVPVYAEDEARTPSVPSSGAGPAHEHGGAVQIPKQPGAGATDGKILYYRNPMGLADTSPVPKKDPMGMDYVPVYADEAEAASRGIVNISPAARSRSASRASRSVVAIWCG